MVLAPTALPADERKSPVGCVNKVILIGNLGAKPELKYTPSNRPVCSMSIATNKVFKDHKGAKKERVEWHRVVVWGDLAESSAKYLDKGRTVYIEGELQTQRWDDRKTGAKMQKTEIVADRVVFLSSGKEGGRQRAWGDDGVPDDDAQDLPPRSTPAPPDAPGDDDIPF